MLFRGFNQIIHKSGGMEVQIFFTHAHQLMLECREILLVISSQEQVRAMPDLQRS